MSLLWTFYACFGPIKNALIQTLNLGCFSEKQANTNSHFQGYTVLKVDSISQQIQLTAI